MKLICYLSNGYPSMDASFETAKNYAAAGCNAVEIGMPAHDPYLDGPLLQEQMAAALANDANYDDYLENATRISNALKDQVDVLVLAYVLTIKEIGVDKFIKFFKKNGFKALVLAGWEDPSVNERLIGAGISISTYVQRSMEPQEIEDAKASTGFIYMQAKSADVNPEYPTLGDCIAHLREEGVDRPIYCGVGLSTPEDFAEAQAAGADGGFVGTTILSVADDPKKLKETISEFVVVQAQPEVAE